MPGTGICSTPLLDPSPDVAPWQWLMCKDRRVHRHAKPTARRARAQGNPRSRDRAFQPGRLPSVWLEARAQSICSTRAHTPRRRELRRRRARRCRSPRRCCRWQVVRERRLLPGSPRTGRRAPDRPGPKVHTALGRANRARASPRRPRPRPVGGLWSTGSSRGKAPRDLKHRLDRRTVIRDAVTLRSVRVFRAGGTPAAVSPDGKTVALGAPDGSMRLASICAPAPCAKSQNGTTAQ